MYFQGLKNATAKSSALLGKRSDHAQFYHLPLVVSSHAVSAVKVNGI